MQMKATATVTPEATPLTLLGQSSPSSSQGIVPTPAPNTETVQVYTVQYGCTMYGTGFVPRRLIVQVNYKTLSSAFNFYLKPQKLDLAIVNLELNFSQ